MVNESNKIIVKVGKKSRVQFANSKVYRAITANDLTALTNKFDDCHIVVIEDISEDEQDAVTTACKNFMSKGEDNSVVFLLTSSEDIASGVADELDCDNIFYTISDLYKFIYEKYGFSTSIYLDDRKKLNSMDNIPDGVTDVFGEVDTITSEDDTELSGIIATIDEKDANGITDEADIVEESEQTIEEVKQTIKEVKQSVEDNKATETETKATEKVDSKQTESESKQVSTETKTTETKKETVENTDNKHIETEPKQVATEANASEKVDNKQTTEEAKQTESETKAPVVVEISTENLPEDIADKIDQLEMQLRDAQYDYNEAVKDVRNAGAKIAKLEETVKILTDEKEIMQKRFNELMVSEEVFEDPISLAQYELLKEQTAKLESRIVELNSTIDSMKETMESKDLDINSSETTITELNGTIESLKKQLSEINESIESGEIHKDIISEYEEKIREASSTHAKTTERLQTAEEDIARLNEELNYSKTLSVEEKYARISYYNTLMSSLIKIKELDDKLSIVKSTNDELRKELSKANKSNEMANNISASDITKLNNKVGQLEAKLSVAEEQLKQKEDQYNSLLETSGVNQNESSALLETNRTLETISRTLREQLGAANKELEQAKRDKAEAIRQSNGLKAQVSTLQKNLQNIAYVGVGSGGESTNGPKPLSGNMSHSQIITVFGSGSFGITTTAMSIANRLSATSKVLYIDFDLVNPMADSWFRVNPMIQNVPGTLNGNVQNTGLGIFLENGTGILSNYMSAIIRNVSKTKGGGIYYLSGVYYTPEASKLAMADYDGLFALLTKNFQYIIIDFGRLGCSEVNDQVIKVISDIAFKNIIVSTTNPFEVRNLKKKIDNIHLDTSRAAWLFNLCSTTALDQNVRNMISPITFDLIPRMEGFEQGCTFLRVNSIRDRFGTFVDNKVFGKR